MSETKSWFFFFKTGKIDKPLARLGKKKRKQIQSNTKEGALLMIPQKRYR